MLTIFQRTPWRVFDLARILARLHVQMHECVSGAELPGQRGRLQRKIQHADSLPAKLQPPLLKALESLPDGDRVCHGDFHPANVLLSGTDATIIDWIDASRGNPLADVARTSIITLGSAASTQVTNIVVKAFIRVFHSAYLKHYFHMRPAGTDEYRHWLPIVAGARLNENIPEVENWLVEQAGKAGQ
jgi:Ser/Thr protein kinase RdoA (MazF antagonist)